MLVNLIAVQYLDPGKYKKFLDRYKVLSIDWSAKYLDAIEMDLELLDKRKDITKIPPATVNSIISSVFNRKWKQIKPQPIYQHETSFSFFLSRKLFREHINMITEEKQLFFCGKINPDTGKFLPILEAGYFMVKDSDGAAKNRDIIRLG